MPGAAHVPCASERLPAQSSDDGLCWCCGSKAFAMMSLKEEDMHADLTGVDDEHRKILDDWYEKLSQKYPHAGFIASSDYPAVQ